MPNKNDDRNFTLDELAVRFQTTVKTLRNEIAKGDLRAFKVGRSWRVTPAAVAEFELGVEPPPQSNDRYRAKWEERKRHLRVFGR